MRQTTLPSLQCIFNRLRSSQEEDKLSTRHKKLDSNCALFRGSLFCVHQVVDVCVAVTDLCGGGWCVGTSSCPLHQQGTERGMYPR